MQDNQPTSAKAASLNIAQAAFSSALIAPELPLPEDVVGPTKAKKAQKRFGVYRNNVMVSLTESLRSAFPTVDMLVGEDYFRAMARVYISGNPPKSAMLATYGEDFGTFLDTFEPLAELPFLGDVARLEFAWLRAYNSADKRPLDPEQLQSIDPEQLGGLTFTLHPACQLLSAGHAAYSIWAAHKTEDPSSAMASVEDHPEEILITRPEWDVTVISMPSGGYTFAKGLADGNTLAEAAGMAAEAHESFDFAQNFGGLLETGALLELHLPKT